MDNDDDAEFSLKDWDLRARIGGRNTGSRRFSASHVRTLREEARSFRLNFVVSSTASSPGYTLRDEIDPSTYSFTNALKALQAKQGFVNVGDSMSPEGFELNSKWCDAERYICNPLSGEVPMECLSAKTLGQRSFRSMTNRFTMSAPLVYPSNCTRPIQSKPPPPASLTAMSNSTARLPLQEKKTVGRTRDVGTQSTPSCNIKSSSPSPTSTPSIGERSRNVKRSVSEAGDTPNSDSKGEGRGGGVDVVRTIQAIISDKEGVEGKGEIVGGEEENDPTGKTQVYSCLSWMMVMRRSNNDNTNNNSKKKKKIMKMKMKKKKRQREKDNPRRKHRIFFLPSEKGC
ncbi:hypothetical protein MLD38_001245 [Melastoma candidum]|uniref:Uncharacterized protein n=1 Tax=Melastoma candidum TaxID=119954 RepID=A0ACB9SC39_9MYRT|nr:hypothetical protein MLD38_001245 [Melastoma candidum]